MQEIKYRESRLCRMLGNPVVYRMAVLLAQRGPLTPSELAKMTGRAVQTISGHLATLRVGDVVRYETARGRTRYWLKHPRQMRGLLGALRRTVRASAKLR
jgi:DNA-binding transcriptional ArsR family regulator